MKSYRTIKRIRAAEFRKSCLINIDMTGASPTAYDRSALLLHAIYPQLPFRHVVCGDGQKHPMVTDIPQRIVLEVCRRYRIVEATAHVISNVLL